MPGTGSSILPCLMGSRLRRSQKCWSLMASSTLRTAPHGTSAASKRSSASARVTFSTRLCISSRASTTFAVRLWNSAKRGSSASSGESSALARRLHWSSLAAVMVSSPSLVRYSPVGPPRVVLPIRSGKPISTSSSSVSIIMMEVSVSIIETSRYCPSPVRSFSRSAAVIA